MTATDAGVLELLKQAWRSIISRTTRRREQHHAKGRP